MALGLQLLASTAAARGAAPTSAAKAMAAVGLKVAAALLAATCVGGATLC